jgi:hypothetical protein
MDVMNLYPEMTESDLVICYSLMNATLKQNYRLKASIKNGESWLKMEIFNDSAWQNKAPKINYMAVVEQDADFFWTEKHNPIEAVDEVLKKAGITKVQQYIDLKTLTESLKQRAAQ